MDATTKLSLTLAGLIAIAWTIALLGLAAITSASPAFAQEQTLQQAAVQTDQTVETDSVSKLEQSGLRLENEGWTLEDDGWHSDIAGQQAKFQREQAVDTLPVLNLDMSFLGRQHDFWLSDDGWQSEAADQQGAAAQQAAAETEQAVETDPAPNLDLSFLSRESDIWLSEDAEPSPASHDQFKSCYAAAEAAYQAGAWQGSVGSSTGGASAFENSVSGFYADQRRQSMQGDC